MANSNTVMEPNKTLLLAQEKTNIFGYFRDFFLIYHENVCFVHSLEGVHTVTTNYYLYKIKKKKKKKKSQK